ncbi:cellulase family glycosylhydrolase [Halomicrobium salinisoli]|uniref:cellulase family glycosylhydrolase n=1 Tax=Halomicrobium salinisoli TaxID=2878391 RepID=UPI001CEFD507|nr:cellulase family glycosylhydrolase [Halomicrobium salinisoli]
MHEPSDHAGDAQHANDPRTAATGRRGFMKLVGAGATVGALGGSMLGSAAGLPGDPTPRLHRDGNVMRDPSDNVVALHGLNVVDPRRANANVDWTLPIEDLIELATNPDEGWNAQVIRLPLQPIDIADPTGDYGELEPGNFDQTRLESYLENHVDDAVQACKERGVYCIVDYHRHRTTDFTTAALDEEVRMFWNTVAPRYAEESHVLYEVYNEPIGANRGGYGSDQAEQCYLRWRETAQPWVDIIQEEAPEAPVIVGSPSWSQYTYLAPDNEFDGDNLMYAGHVYAQEYLRPLSESFGAPAEEVPVFMTEWGFDSTGESESHLNGSVGTEGQQFESFYEEYDHVHSTAWILSHFWSPTMVDESYEVSTEYGSFVQDFLESKTGVNRPGDGGPDPVGPPEEDRPSWPENATDPDGDGLYEDLNGNGEADYSDVVDYFNNMDSDRMQSNVQYYDYNGNGEVDFADLVDLFKQI